ncbi:MAG: peptidoglycan DD-metalloendopeptidase family protein [Gammaproteobacteria bacterium]|nr:peptidoglycan DD-metalloendopeptidase family protein [Gammaproteobacteria bacterium]
MQASVHHAETSTLKSIALTLPNQSKSEVAPEDAEKAPAPILTGSNTIEAETPATPDGSQSAEVGQIEVSSDNNIAQQPSSKNIVSPDSGLPTNEQDDTAALEQNAQVENEVRWLKEKVNKGDSISKIFSRMNLSASLLHRILNSSTEAKELASIKPGEILKVKIDGEGNFLGLILERNAIESLNIQERDDGFRTRTVERGLETRIANASGTITNSLYQSAQRTGLSDQLIMELANIFGWDIDFALEIRAGDQFSLIYEDEYLDGELYGHGSILAAEFINQGNVFRAIRYQDKNGNSNYFSPDGRSMRKAFLRAPVDFRRISSHFTKARWHPVLGKKRPHKGVDYAAAPGTPIKAAGDGRVIFRGIKGGYGKTVILKHGDQYTTLYGHMSNYNNTVKSGSRVKQGQTIGYVGQTGLATGPHLHYEFRVNDVHRNPLTVKIPLASPIKKEYKADFTRKSKPLLAQLEMISRTQLATAE